ncbi:MAG: phosphoacetylglucosamine mutase [Amphiamblys sp. WSBS2006]|nr:MAG: phosphoacetylglucosamine mutase [Amphiamblys sp. WSBS2006]
MSRTESGIREYLSGLERHRVRYGTGGIRGKEREMDYAVFVCGFVCALKSKKEGVCGMMVTASHNPESDNGVKMVESSGVMLGREWVGVLCECLGADDLVECSRGAIEERYRIDMARRGVVVVGRDTRASGERLVGRIKKACCFLGCGVVDLGMVSTPQLHEATSNYAENLEERTGVYYEKRRESFYRLVAGCVCSPLSIDCANGVGSVVFEGLQLKQDISLHNRYEPGKGRLNVECGADYVVIERKAPAGMCLREGQRCASVDGDADRSVYFYAKSGSFCLLSGDRMAVLFTMYLQKLLAAGGVSAGLRVVQTAYSNGASSRFLKDTLGVSVVVAKTGVEHLHREAERADIGVYFEANGHGTVLFSEKTRSEIGRRGDTAAQSEARDRLGCVAALMSQKVGDAVSNILLTEAILCTSVSLENWAGLYTELPCKQVKLPARDRSVFCVGEDEARLLRPAGLQKEIDEVVSWSRCARAFIRASGTEDVVRLYVEAETESRVSEIAETLCEIVAGYAQ